MTKKLSICIDLFCIGAYTCLNNFTSALVFMENVLITTDPAKYNSRVIVTLVTRNVLYAEQARRQLLGQRINIVELASELLNEKAVELAIAHGFKMEA